ncbi:cation:proton antiporter [Sphingorhabdus sp. Alg239-R122]|uniref:cation:proton antiporter domain-containing protein n=1 Tax=Sphingorhabdus sp. Alg239-R122 TaxID=2305989 RepID=UPI0013DA3208|nr:cation:proton antiporter [Sphingorhabdus sp. Alg239-R122]
MAGEIEYKSVSDALVILGAAGIVIPAFNRFRITPIIGFILVGILVGPAGLGSLVDRAPWLQYVTITDAEAIKPFADFGIILLLFSIGLELSFKRLWMMRKLVFGVGAAELLIAGFIIGTALYLMGQPWAGAMGLGLALALSSTALVLPMAGTSSPVGRAALAMLLFEDMAIVPIIFILGALAPYAESEGLEGLATTLWEGALVIIVMLVLGRFLLPRLFAQAARTKSPELFLAASLLVVIASALATAAVGLSPIVGALLAGLIIAETDYHGEVESIIEPFKGLALGIFLITVGMSVDLKVIAQNWVSLTLAVVGVVVVKTLVTGLLLRFSGAGKGTSAEAGLLMSSPSETTLIVLASASAAGLIGASTAQFWQIVTAIGLTITPLLARVGHDVARWLDMKSNEQTAGINDVEDAHRTVIFGFGRVGMLVADMLKEHGQPYIAIDSDIDTIATARRNGYHAGYGDISRPGMVDRLKLGHARALVITMDEPVLAAQIVKRVRGWVPDLPIISRARDSDHAAELYRMGVSVAVPETLESSLQLSEALLVDLGIAMGPVIASVHEKRDEFRRKIMEEGGLTEKPSLKSHHDSDLKPKGG